MIALLLGDWNHDALRYIGVILVLFIQPQNEDEAGGVANDFKFHLVCTYLFGVGIWMGVGFDGASSGFLELHCATWFVLIAFCMINLKPERYYNLANSEVKYSAIRLMPCISPPTFSSAPLL
jgi:hypothetical protein